SLTSSGLRRARPIANTWDGRAPARPAATQAIHPPPKQTSRHGRLIAVFRGHLPWLSVDSAHRAGARRSQEKQAGVPWEGRAPARPMAVQADLAKPNITL